MVMVGASPEDLDALANQMGQAVDDLTHQIRIPLRQLTNYSPWQGSDATRFRQDWVTTLEPQLAQVAAALQGAEQTLRRDAQEQRAASSGAGLGGTIADIGATAGSGGVTTGGSSASQTVQKLADFGSATADLGLVEWFENMSNAPEGISWADYIKQGKNLGKIAAALDGVAYVGAAMDLASGHGEFSDVLDLAGDAAGLIDKAGGWAGAGGILRHAGVVGHVLGIGSDFARTAEAWQNGDWLGVAYNVAHAGARAVAIGNPAVAAGLVAWDLGVAAGTAIASSPVVQEFTANTISAAATAVQNVGSVAVDVVRNPGKAAANVVTGAADALGGFVGGFFGKGKK